LRRGFFDSIIGVSGILDRPVKPGDDGCGCGARLDSVIARSDATKQSISHNGSELPLPLWER
jgi:hypothetical protein